jgi:hypothetical protein
MASENEKARLVRNSKKGLDPKVDDIIDNPDGHLAKLHAKALSYWENKLRKSYIESARMATDDVKEIARVVEIPEELLAFYYEFFFDISDWDRLDKIEHIEKQGHKHKSEALLKMWTLTQGLDFLAWRLGKKVSISPVEGLVDLFSTCMFRSKEAMFNGAGTEAGDQSIKWTKQATDIGRLLKLWVMDSAAAKKDLEIAIREVVPDFGGLDELLKQDQEELKRDSTDLKSEQSEEDSAQIALVISDLQSIADLNAEEEISDATKKDEK